MQPWSIVILQSIWELQGIFAIVNALILMNTDLGAMCVTKRLNGWISPYHMATMWKPCQRYQTNSLESGFHIVGKKCVHLKRMDLSYNLISMKKSFVEGSVL